MATTSFYAGETYKIEHSASSGLGFFGVGGFGYSVQVANWQENSYITNAAGSVEGAAVDNLQWINQTGCEVNRDDLLRKLRGVPNDKASLMIEFEHASSVDVQNVEFRGYDGVSVSNAPSGVYVRAFEIIHSGISFTDSDGLGDTDWTALSGADSILDLGASPGSGGLYSCTGGADADYAHAWWVGLSMSPITVGSKTGKFYFALEYL